ncbi:DUF4149 domain-containing protein [Caenimonas terrae]|uniref:DUF4149 domain-containing protein n=1 Tax=Caenimonas terrae TaxID=696074 RepID=A0ABW0NC58_9BURK
MSLQRLPSGLALLAAALWWGSLTVTGFVTVPLLFTHLPTPAIAGNMAARLFAAQTWIALGCGILLLAIARGRDSEARIDWGGGAMAFIAGGMLLALLSEFAVAPRIVARDNLPLWHAVGSGMYLLQWVCAGVTLWKLGSRLRSAGPS